MSLSFDISHHASEPYRTGIRQRTRQHIRAVLLLLSGVMLSACSSDHRGSTALGLLNLLTPGSAYTLQADIAYGPDARQQLDLYVPKNVHAASRLVVFVYGGAWKQGIRTDYAFLAQALARAGHWVAIPDYRLFPDVQYPAFVEDVASALLSLPELVSQHGATDRLNADDGLTVTLMGHSSGAHLAAVIATNPRVWLGSSARISIDQLIVLSGPYDLPLDNAEVIPVFSSVVDIPENENPALPLSHVDELHPPTLLIHGRDDKRVLARHTQRYADRLTETGIEHQVVWLDGAGHAATVLGLSTLLPVADIVLDEVSEFLAD